ncbi:N-acetylglucosamine kinase [Paenibacillus aceti]|uniref:N-acetylmuramic acid/N-acetylglucosamine kinase n=1 Tax=Paenibacillus aceti TaxID=1820010 RepID=A0ABQ1W013_9BACL|nr:BadF/BadG/BcrA/BcrD ATPase family protein [Paenibacillus aceti]GGG08042.1 N-acetylmuramic acid/N-acetylglucosamine kinase [Paenibacillus aceti]
MRYAAGLDGGGTKTKVVIADEHGQMVESFASGPINYNGQDEGVVERNIGEIIARVGAVCGGLEHCVQICVGAAGISAAGVTERLSAAVRAAGYVGGLTLAGDHETALYGALSRPPGLILIAGTGSICYGRNEQGSSHRTGGMGHLIDDEGSGYSVGRELLSALVQAHDGRIPPTVISGLIYEKLQLPAGALNEVIRFVYDPHRTKKEIAALAPLLTEACSVGDAAALDIAQRSAAALFELIVPVAERLGLQKGRLALAGSVLLHNSHIQNALRERIAGRYAGMTCILPQHDAAWGAMMMAWEQHKI